MNTHQARCILHGPYSGLLCPWCNSLTAPQSYPARGDSAAPATRLDPTPTLMRIASALERIADEMEGGKKL